MNRADTFDRIYRSGAWASGGSGEGSDPVAAHNYVGYVNHLLATLATSRHAHPSKKVVDLGCGDGRLAALYQLPEDWTYEGHDCSPTALTLAAQRFRGVPVSTHRLYLTDIVDAPEPISGGLVLIKDVFQHLSNESILKVLDRIPRGTYVVVTDDVPVSGPVIVQHGGDRYVPGDFARVDIEDGEYSPVMLSAPPFVLDCRIQFFWGDGRRIKATSLLMPTPHSAILK
jgi:SAM-dependent methyltransferase